MTPGYHEAGGGGVTVRQKGGKKKKTIENFLPLGFFSFLFPFSKVTGGEKNQKRREGGGGV